jgi:uncharacterized membrane protein
MSDLSARQRLDTPRTSRRRLTPQFDVEAAGRFGESFARFLGTGRYLAIQTVFVVVWILLNLFAVTLRWDPYPFILLNLAFSTQAAYAAPLILLAGNRSAKRDRLTLEHAAAEGDLEEKQNVDLLRGNREILEHVQALEERILALEKQIVASMER